MDDAAIPKLLGRPFRILIFLLTSSTAKKTMDQCTCDHSVIPVDSLDEFLQARPTCLFGLLCFAHLLPNDVVCSLLIAFPSGQHGKISDQARQLVKEARHEQADGFKRKDVHDRNHCIEIVNRPSNSHAVSANISHVSHQRQDDLCFNVWPILVCEGWIDVAESFTCAIKEFLLQLFARSRGNVDGPLKNLFQVVALKFRLILFECRFDTNPVAGNDVNEIRKAGCQTHQLEEFANFVDRETIDIVEHDDDRLAALSKCFCEFVA